jgi:hypothetical protein
MTAASRYLRLAQSAGYLHNLDFSIIDLMESENDICSVGPRDGA